MNQNPGTENTCYPQNDYYYDHESGSYKKRGASSPAGSSSNDRKESENGGGTALTALSLALAGLFIRLFPFGFILDFCALCLGIYAFVRKRRRALAAAAVIFSLFSLFSSGAFFIFTHRIGGIRPPSETQTEDTRSDSPETGQPGALSAEESERQAAQERDSNLTREEYALSDQLLVFFENGNLTDVNLHMNVIFYDGDDQMLSIEERYLNSIPAGGRSVISIPAPRDQDYAPVAYDHYEFIVESEEIDPSYECRNYGASLEIASNIGSDGSVLAAVANPAGLTFNNVELACIYYQAGQPAGITTQYIHDLAEQGVVKFSTPYISTPDGSVLLSFDSYEILVLETDYNID